MLGLAVPTFLGEGWLVAFIVAAVPAALAIAKAVANRWREPKEALEETVRVLEREAKERTEKLTQATIEKMLLEARLESCEGELENWRSGRWSTR